ncbi:hypothetical protein OH492_13980 [Vibrio chagasii]|nr:hypothetical protein [Vibrio chagasii]
MAGFVGLMLDIAGIDLLQSFCERESATTLALRRSFSGGTCWIFQLGLFGQAERAPDRLIEVPFGDSVNLGLMVLRLH